MYLSYIFYFKESTIITTTKTKTDKQKRITKKEYRNVEGKSLPVVFDFVLPIEIKSLLLFFTCSLYELKGGNWLVLSNILFTFFPPSFSEGQKSLLFVFKVGIPILNKCFPPKLAANEQLKKCLFGYSWYGPLFRLRILFVIKFLTNLSFSFPFFCYFFFLCSLISY